MNCLLELCFISAIYINGGLGVQHTVHYGDEARSNAYGRRIGEASLVIEFNNGLYVEAKHISGIDTKEDDYGINAVMIGAKIYFKGK